MGKKRKGKKRKDVGSRAYEAAMAVPMRRHVVGAHLSQDAAAERAQGRIRDWGRYLDENSPISISVLDEFVKGVVGAGIVTIPKPLRADGSVDEELGRDMIAMWREWIRRCDVTGELHWHEAQRLSARAWPRDGEHFLQHVMGRDRYPFTPDQVPYRIELLESDMCPRDFNANGYRQGVLHNEWNQPNTYAIYKHHPGDTGMIASAAITFDDLKPVPAEIITHLKAVKRWPATRGISMLHGAIATLYDIKDLEDSERQKNRILASWSAATQKGPDYEGVDDTDESGDRYIAVEGGSIIDTLRKGESIVGVGPDYPIANMPDHILDQVRRVCGAVGVRASSVSRRYEGSYSSQRQELVESEGAYKIREDAFISKVVREVYDRWVFTAAMSGMLAIPADMTLTQAVNAEYRGPVTPWIDPLKEVQADALAVEKGFAGIDQVRIKRGAPEEMIGQPAPALERPPAPRQLALIEDEEEAA
jgi:lambda family phage portal protein